MRRFWLGLISSLLCVGMIAASSQEIISSQDLTVQLEGFRTRAQLTYPSSQKSPFPTLLLLHAGYPSDLNASFFENGTVISRNFLTIAEHLSARGFAVIRYNKRFVTSATEIDQQRYDTLGINDFVADARAVLKVMGSHPLVDAKRIFVLGWSEGALVGVKLALEKPDLRGLVLIGPPVKIEGKDTALLEQARQLRLPVLVMQGASDSITPPEQTQRLETALEVGNSTRLTYAMLGHGLGLVGPQGAQFTAVALEPLEDLTAWLKRTSGKVP